MHEARNRYGNTSGQSSSANIGLLLGATIAGFVVGTLLNTPKRTASRGSSEITLSSHVTINRSPEEIYQFWRDFQNLPKVMSFIERIEPREGKITHWVARGPAGPAIEWDAEVVDDQPGKLLSWRSVEGSELQTWGTVAFSPRGGDRGTEVSVKFNFYPPGKISGTLARFMSGLENSVLDSNLKDLKSQLETGEVATSRRYKNGRDATGPGQLS